MKCNFAGRDTNSITSAKKEKPIVSVSEQTPQKTSGCLFDSDLSPFSHFYRFIDPKIGYTSLPGEVRNKIMALVLCPGIIYLQAKRTKGNNFTSYSNDPHLARDGTPLPPPGVQMLATCRQVYNGGRVMYYAGNVFDLPPGPVEVTRGLMAKVRPENLALMRHFRIRLSLLDLTPPVIEQLEKDYEVKAYHPEGRPFRFLTLASSPIRHRNQEAHIEGHKYGIEAKRILAALWEAKISYLSAKFPEIRSLQISTIRHSTEGGVTTCILGEKSTLVIVGASVLLSTKNPRLDQPRSWKQPLYLAMPEFGKLISRLVRNIGWARLKNSITPTGISSFEREVPRVSRSDVAYLANRFRSQYHVVQGDFVKDLAVEVDIDSLGAAHGGCRLLW